MVIVPKESSDYTLVSHGTKVERHMFQCFDQLWRDGGESG